MKLAELNFRGLDRSQVVFNCTLEQAEGQIGGSGVRGQKLVIGENSFVENSILRYTQHIIGRSQHVGLSCLPTCDKETRNQVIWDFLKALDDFANQEN